MVSAYLLLLQFKVELHCTACKSSTNKMQKGLIEKEKIFYTTKSVWTHVRPRSRHLCLATQDCGLGLDNTGWGRGGEVFLFKVQISVIDVIQIYDERREKLSTNFMVRKHLQEAFPCKCQTGWRRPKPMPMASCLTNCRRPAFYDNSPLLTWGIGGAEMWILTGCSSYKLTLLNLLEV